LEVLKPNLKIEPGRKNEKSESEKMKERVLNLVVDDNDTVIKDKTSSSNIQWFMKSMFFSHRHHLHHEVFFLRLKREK